MLSHYWPTLWTRYDPSRPFSMIFTFWSCPLGGHGGHLGVRFGRKMTFCAILSICITLNRRLNTIDRLYAQDIKPPDAFQWFLLFDPTHWRVTGSFRGQIWPKNGFLCYIIHLDHPKSPFKQYWPTLCARYNTSRPFSMILLFDMAFFDILSIWITLIKAN